MKKILTLCIAAAFPLIASAQLHYGNPELMGKGGGGTVMMYDYHSIGVNPANLGYSKNKTFSIGLAEVGAGFQSDVFGNTAAVRSFFELNDDTRALLKNTLNDKGLDMELGLSFIAASAQIPVIGGLAVSFRDRISSRIIMNGTGADVLLYGKDAAFFDDTNNLKNITPARVLDGTNISYLHYREINFAYGRKIISLSTGIGELNIYTGVGAKKLYGVSVQELRSLDGEFTFHNSFSPGYGLDYEKTGAGSDLDGEGGFFNAAGSGFAADAGMNVGIGVKGIPDMLNFGFAFIDMGSIKWDKNALFANNDVISEIDTNALKQIKSLRIKSIADVLLDSAGLLNLQQGSFTTKLPSKFRVGTSLKIGKLVQVGLDAIMPLADVETSSLQKPYYVLAAEVDAKLVKVSTAIGGNSYYSYNVPLGIALSIFPFVRLELSTADVAAFLGKDTAHMSAALGIKISVL